MFNPVLYSGRRAFIFETLICRQLCHDKKQSAHPTASAGATLCAVRLSGKLKGETMLMTPMGKLRTMAAMPLVRFEMSIGAYSPAWHT